MAVERRVKSVMAKSTKPRKPKTTPAERAAARKDYAANKTAINKDRKAREAKKTTKEKNFDKERNAVTKARREGKDPKEAVARVKQNAKAGDQKADRAKLRAKLATLRAKVKGMREALKAKAEAAKTPAGKRKMLYNGRVKIHAVRCEIAKLMGKEAPAAPKAPREPAVKTPAVKKPAV